MNICLVNHGAKIPALKYGGTQRVVWSLGKELHQLGHEITFLVPEGSSSDFGKVQYLKPDVDLNKQIPPETDIVHLHFKPEVELSTPYLVTMHGNSKPGEEMDLNTVFLSENHALRNNSGTFVYNGLSWDDYPKPDIDLPRKDFHFLGKASWKVKNSVGAIKIATQSGAGMHVLGGKRWSGRNLKNGFPYFLNKNIRFHGFVDNDAKIRVMEKSKGLIFPVQWHEPFGLAIIESLFAGCAVFGTPNGSLKELVPSEVGFLGSSEKEIVDGIQSFDYDPRKCHEYAFDMFNSRKMALAYEQLYEKVLGGENLNPHVPTHNEDFPKALEL